VKVAIWQFLIAEKFFQLLNLEAATEYWDSSPCPNVKPPMDAQRRSVKTAVS